jgi:NAD(P)-dependent dehydrogenase (short-subunit alcohol dehydrogenase family)
MPVDPSVPREIHTFTFSTEKHTGNPLEEWLKQPMFKLDHKSALITGAGSGIGEAIAMMFSQAGANVWIVDRESAAGNRTVVQIRSAGGSAEFVQLDVADPDAALNLAAQLPDVEILVNNAGIGHVGSLLSTTAVDLDRLHSVNVRGPFNLCKAFVPAMLKRGHGSVINIASISGLIAVRERLAYTISKHAVVGLTRALALDHSHTGVRFNAICPGRVETPFVRSRLAEYPDPEKAYQDMAATQLNGRMARPAEIAASALYLASDEAAMVTGSCLSIDGGWGVGK